MAVLWSFLASKMFVISGGKACGTCLRIHRDQFAILDENLSGDTRKEMQGLLQFAGQAAVDWAKTVPDAKAVSDMESDEAVGPKAASEEVSTV